MVPFLPFSFWPLHVLSLMGVLAVCAQASPLYTDGSRTLKHLLTWHMLAEPPILC